MSWTALIPLKPASAGKTRLAAHLPPEERAALSRSLFEHVAGVLGRVPALSSLILLSEKQPETWQSGWIEDRGRGLNGELEAARFALGAAPLLVIHADLPLLAETDIIELLDAAEQAGCAIAPDRHGTGTNALALRDGRPFEFRFGPDSFRLHRAQAGNCRTVELQGLGLDLDTPDDLNTAIAGGWSKDQ